ncbi:MAG: MobF family relaxase, partial [Vicinamibacterales bacterium]
CWGGKAATRHGLSGHVDAAGYYALVDNVNPQTGEQLTPRQKDNRRVGYDFTFSAPKPVSVLFELSGDQRILDAFRDSVRETMSEIESEMKTRVRVRGHDEDRVTGNLAYAEFVHFTARPVDGIPDPHLHAHCLAFNTTFDDVEGRWKAGQFGDLKRDADYYESAFHARFAKRLNDLGYQTERQGTSFGLAGLPASITDKFSRRRNEIESAAERAGVQSAEGKHAIGYFGRENKTIDLGKAQLRQAWAARLTADERAALDRKAQASDIPDQESTAETAWTHALDHSFERASALPEKQVKAEALRFGVGAVLPEEVDRAAQTPGIIRHDVDGRAFITTRDVLAEEQRMLDFARRGRGLFQPFGNGRDGLTKLSDEQRTAALHILASRDRITGVRGGAGTGKTHLMQSTVEGIEQGALVPGGPHSKVFVFAPSAQASRGVLRADGFKDADTVERLLSDDKLQAKVRNQVLWVDEAGMLGSRDMRRIVDLAERENCRVILSGDYRQHASVGRGDAFRLLESEAGVTFAELTRIRRQRNPWYRQAVAAISGGSSKDAARGFDELKKIGAIVEASGDDRHRLLAADYVDAANDGKTALVIAPTHAEGRALSARIREALKHGGELGERDRTFMTRTATNWTQAQRRDARNYQPGQVVQFHQHVAGTRTRVGGSRQTEGGFVRGEAAVVVGQENGEVLLQRQDGARGRLPLDKADRFQVYDTRELAIARGERIRITRNGYAKPDVKVTRRGGSVGLRQEPVRINNGDVFTVDGFTAGGDMRLSNGTVLPKDFGHVTHGYVDTSHASQGKTVDRVFISVGGESLPAANRAQWYVSVSRGRETVKVYTEDAAGLRDAIQRSPDRLSAVELVKRAPKRPRFQLTSFAFERQRVTEYLKRRATAAWQQVQRKREQPEGLDYAR